MGQCVQGAELLKSLRCSRWLEKQPGILDAGPHLRFLEVQVTRGLNKWQAPSEWFFKKDSAKRRMARSESRAD